MSRANKGPEPTTSDSAHTAATTLRTALIDRAEALVDELHSRHYTKASPEQAAADIERLSNAVLLLCTAMREPQEVSRG